MSAGKADTVRESSQEIREAHWDPLSLSLS